MSERAKGFERVAIVSLYGIRGLGPGVDLYTRRTIDRLHRLLPNVVILSGGGRHGLSAHTEADSVQEIYRRRLPAEEIWLERYSRTTWQNLMYSVQMLDVMEAHCRELIVIGDRSRMIKTRLALAILRRRFPVLDGAVFRTVPIYRKPVHWRDQRLVQLLLGPIQVVHEALVT